jgi:hypothetical protein
MFFPNIGMKLYDDEEQIPMYVTMFGNWTIVLGISGL